jgi:hypothetical protein
MSKCWYEDIHEMHEKYGVHDWVKNNPDKLKQFLDFRFAFLKEELDEGIEAMIRGDSEEIVDALIDLCVVAIGTLDAFDVDAEKAWDEVDVANMSKEVGVKESRPNPLGLPDLIKPEGWKAPSHAGNHGLLTQVFEE